MPRNWHDRHAANKIKNDADREFYRSIVADKKPSFMRYIYPALMKQYNTYIKNTNKNALREFQMTVAELKAIPQEQLTDRQAEFLRYYHYRMPVGTGKCVMNKICSRFEEEFDGYIRKRNDSISFDYRFMRSDAEYSRAQYNAVKKLYDDYNQRLRGHIVFAENERIGDYDLYSEISIMNTEFKKECSIICSNREILCNIILDICYTRSSTKRFAWSMCGTDIIHNLLSVNDNTISFPVLDKDGDIEYCCNRFSIKSKKVEIKEWE